MKNWRTTLAGCVGAAAAVALGMVQNGTLDGNTIALAAGLAAVGAMGKDAGQSGVEK